MCTFPKHGEHPISSKFRIWSRGAQKNFLRFYRYSKVELGEQSEPILAGGCLRALEALAFLIVKYAFSHFFWYFFLKFLMYICVGISQNIFQNKDSADCDKCNIPFVYVRRSRVLFVLLV